MADDPKQRGSPDRDLIDPDQKHERDYWCAVLGCTEAELRAAIKAVGNSAAKVRKHLGK